MTDYPKSMVHPHYVPARVERPSPGKPLLPGEGPQEPRAAVFPPVMVMNPDQEGQHRALGYIMEGETMDYEPIEYPKWVGDQLVNSREEEEALSAPKPKAKKAKEPTQ